MVLRAVGLGKIGSVSEGVMACVKIFDSFWSSCVRLCEGGARGEAGVGFFNAGRGRNV